MRDIVYLLVFDGYADWEPALATAEIHKSGRYAVKAVGFTDAPVVSMGGLRVTPDAALEAMEMDRAALFILPGGDLWEAGPREELWPLLRRLDADGVPVAAICAATLEVTRAGLHRGRQHTSNGLEYLRSMVPGYDGEADYVPDLSASDRGLITASGAAPVEFARDVLAELEVYPSADLRAWFELFKYGVLPAAI
ncbi:MAG TPA: type 1 glutamine amidotransferase family protein [Longimicrobium sp.]|nr:type 1 glutamine amidotransferase family protein [Longimicrobium sp.]